MANSTNKTPIKIITTAIRWTVGILFAICALGNGFHYSSIFLIFATLLMLPLKWISAFFSSRNIKTSLIIVIAVVLFFVGILTSPPSQTEDTPPEKAPQTTTENSPAETTKPDTTKEDTTKPETTKPNTTKSDTTKPSTTKPETTKPETTKPSTTTKPQTTSKDETEEMVWVSSSGKKYHSKSTCSNMTSPRQISLESAKKQGYTACKKCH